MYLFSLNAVAKESYGDFRKGEEVPFIVYIDFKDLFGAEQLATLFVMREGFREVKILKRRQIKVDDALKKDPQIQQALNKGYCVQAFEAH